MKKNKIAFFWFGFDGRYGQWRDGLYMAMKLLEKEYEVRYYDINAQTLADVQEFQPDVVLLWEAPICSQGKDGWAYNAVRNLPFKKILLFAGGMIKKEWVQGFDLLAVESRINEEECTNLGIPWFRAFGVNTEAFKPIPSEKKYKGIHPGTCASWKRQNLMCKALKGDACAVGRGQDSDPAMFDECRALGSVVLPEHSAEGVAKLLNESQVLVQTCDFYGGGQRATLEAMACGIPVVVMSDSPKNREFVEESGFGVVCEPDENRIREAVDSLIANKLDPQIGIDYVKACYTEKHYAEALKKTINQLLK